MPKLKYKFAFDSNTSKPVWPWLGRKGGAYHLLDTEGNKVRMIFRQCAEKTSHFSVWPGFSGSEESLIHCSAKYLLAYFIGERRLNGLPLVIAAPGKKKPISHRFELADCPEIVVELMLSNGLRADVGITQNGLPVLLFEILHTHKVTVTKARKLPCACYELIAESLIEDISSGRNALVAHRYWPSAEFQKKQRQNKALWIVSGVTLGLEALAVTVELNQLRKSRKFKNQPILQQVWQATVNTFRKQVAEQ